MDLKTLKFAALLPRFLQRDPTALALAGIIDGWIADLMAAVDTMMTWDTANLPEAVLDELATSLGMFWYRLDVDVDVKRVLIDSAIYMYRHMGTPWAVQQIAIDYFGDALVQEWWTYGEAPYHFRVRTGNIVEGTREAEKFRHIVEQTKNLRSVLDTILIENSLPDATAYMAGALQHAYYIAMEMEG